MFGKLDRALFAKAQRLADAGRSVSQSDICAAKSLVRIGRVVLT